MNFKFKTPLNLILGLGIFLVGLCLFPIHSIASGTISSNIYLDSDGNFNGVALSGNFNHYDSWDSLLFPISSVVVAAPNGLTSNFTGSLNFHIVTSEGDYIVASSVKRTSSGSTITSRIDTSSYLNGYPISWYIECNVQDHASTKRSYFTINYTDLFTSDFNVRESYTGNWLNEKLTYISDNTDVIIDNTETLLENTELILQALGASTGTGFGHFYGSYSPCNYAFTTTLSNDYENKVMDPGANIIFCNGDKVVNSVYLNVTSVASKVYFNSNSSGKYRFVFSSVLNTDSPTTFSQFNFPIYDEDGNVLVRYHASDFTELIYPFGGNSSGKYVHFFYADFEFQTDSAICGFGLRAQMPSAIDHSYDSFALYGYTGTVTDLIDWYEKNWNSTSTNVGEINNQIGDTNDTIGNIGGSEDSYFDNYDTYIGNAGINEFSFTVIANELVVASTFINNIYNSFPSVFKYFIIGIMTIGVFALILSVGGRISKRRG